ncbi:ferredoxin [Variovorax boronicumulans]|uniref:Ferredoxin n=1 Tax=Variovorax boronicumulans TaxID=436515 RepID=A0AAW8D1B4_9BURK|nr:ferredoxin [Variovorax boronicumulans]MDQ0056340.1 ferredoxin [Variovorax boronicumulans]
MNWKTKSAKTGDVRFHRRCVDCSCLQVCPAQARNGQEDEVAAKVRFRKTRRTASGPFLALGGPARRHREIW